ncbi:hypothetical protein F4778DRAFT_796476 [Xylariomycetidae sp. FL2044]|nr:hypothetical protein F4778DRAFT_796476 [Xylariomycetidae sp. FL2044]
MCLKIITHTLKCDIRPLMPHLVDPSIPVIDLFTAPHAKCPCLPPHPHDDDECHEGHETTFQPDDDRITRCDNHGCCQPDARAFPCGCGTFVEYHRYKPSSANTATTPVTKFPIHGGGACRTTVRVAPEGLKSGVWRDIASMDEVLAASGPLSYPLPSEELRIARRGLRVRGADLAPKARELNRTVARRQMLLERPWGVGRGWRGERGRGRRGGGDGDGDGGVGVSRARGRASRGREDRGRG